MKDNVDKTLRGLKDFQLKTVNYILHQFNSGRTRMLIADEVGLGKTIVAKGIIARLFEQNVLNGDKTSFNVVYVCSNQAIAKQNLGKLNFTEDKNLVSYSSEDDRITSLAYADSTSDKQPPFTIKAFTPATSFDDKTHAGRWDERILLYRILFRYAEIEPHKNSLKWILKGNNRISDKRWKDEIKKAEDYELRGLNGPRPIRAKLRTFFRTKMEEEVSPETLPRSFEAVKISYPIKYWTLLKKLCQLGVRKNSHNYDFSRELIIHLRLTLSQVCIKFLDADIFILDEFQRYKNLIENNPEKDSQAIEMARAIFSENGTKILMLSATPFKAYTNDFDETNGEVHHEEFETVLRFLNKDCDENYWKEFQQRRNSIFSALRHPDTLNQVFNQAKENKTELEKMYRQCMVRTERFLVSKDKNTLIKSMLNNKFMEPSTSDIEDFVAIDQITRHLNTKHKKHLPVPLEYVKSSPFALSFLEGYQHRKILHDVASGDDDLQEMLKKQKHAWLNLDAVSKYKKLNRGELPNGKLRLLLDESVYKGGWKLLWVPPTMPYYDFGTPFSETPHFSKTIVFSSWILVPRMISALVSYEAERLCVGNSESISKREKDEEKREYFIKRRHPRPQIVYRTDKDGLKENLSQPANIIYLYPSVFLAHIYDPAANLSSKSKLSQIKGSIKSKISDSLRSDKIQSFSTGKGDWRSWFWAAPILLDKTSPQKDLVAKWLGKGIPSSEVATDSEDNSQQRDEKSGKSKYFQSMEQLFQNPEAYDLPLLNDSQIDQVAKYLTNLAIGSPAVCYLRTQLRYFELRLEYLDSAFDVASGFVTLFNKPESIAIVRLCTSQKEKEELTYLDRVLEYSISGNIQSMLDEYYHLIKDLEGLHKSKDISDYLTDVLSIRTATIQIDDLKSFLKKSQDSDNLNKRRAIRTHFAVDFGGKKLSTSKSSGRQINIRQAFNSPFRPFVLATTSIGQEGLDFHLYCRKIFHWNLPSNAIDLEQREGRINRYKGLVIRQILANRYLSDLSSEPKSDVWKTLFKVAENKEGKGIGKCELIPFWHTETTSENKIERFVPLYPFSKDIEKYNNLLKVLAYYRLTFGQPRQEELIKALSFMENADINNRTMELIINLCPMEFYDD